MISLIERVMYGGKLVLKRKPTSSYIGEKVGNYGECFYLPLRGNTDVRIIVSNPIRLINEPSPYPNA